MCGWLTLTICDSFQLVPCFKRYSMHVTGAVVRRDKSICPTALLNRPTTTIKLLTEKGLERAVTTRGVLQE